MLRKQVESLSKSIAPIWKPKKVFAAGALCMYNGLRWRAKIANNDKRFTPRHWEFDDIGDAGGGSGVTSFKEVGGVVPTIVSGKADLTKFFSSKTTSTDPSVKGVLENSQLEKSITKVAQDLVPYKIDAAELGDNGQLVDRSFNYVTCGETVKTLVLPLRNSGFARDFVIRVTVPSTLTTVGGIALSGISSWEGDALAFAKGTTDKKYYVSVTEVENRGSSVDTPTLYIRVVEGTIQTLI